MSYQTTNPYNGEIIKKFESHTDAQMEKAVKTAVACYETWRNTSFAERAKITAKAAKLMLENTDELAGLITLEMGKLIAQAKGEVKLSAEILKYYAENAEEFLAPQILKPNEGEAVIMSEPIGVLFGVQPWNFPYYQLARFAAPNIMAASK